MSAWDTGRVREGWKKPEYGSEILQKSEMYLGGTPEIKGKYVFMSKVLSYGWVSC